jgi:hypothetical protein
VLLSWKLNGKEPPTPSVEWMEAQLDHLKCQRNVLDKQVNAVESELKRRKVEDKK